MFVSKGFFEILFECVYEHLGRGQTQKVFPRRQGGKEFACLVQDTRVRSLGQEDPLKEEVATHSSLENPMDGVVWQAIVHGVTKILAHTHTHTHRHRKQRLYIVKG